MLSWAYITNFWQICKQIPELFFQINIYHFLIICRSIPKSIKILDCPCVKTENVIQKAEIVKVSSIQGVICEKLGQSEIFKIYTGMGFYCYRKFIRLNTKTATATGIITR